MSLRRTIGDARSDGSEQRSRNASRERVLRSQLISAISRPIGASGSLSSMSTPDASGGDSSKSAGSASAAARSDAADASAPAPTGPLHRTRAQVQRLLISGGLREEPDAETDELVALLLKKLAQEAPGDDEAAAELLQVRRAFLYYRFALPFAQYRRGDRFYNYLDTTLNLVSLFAGIAASLVAALEAPKQFTIALGVLIAACQTLSQWLKPGQRASQRGRAASELRSEAWDLLQGRDRYRGKNFYHAWDIFCDQIDKVEEREDTDEDKESQSRPPAGGVSSASGG
jgi:hypothetical protein